MSTTDMPGDSAEENTNKPESGTTQTKIENCIPAYEKGYDDGVRDAMELVEEMTEAGTPEASDTPENKQTPEPINPS